MTTPMLATHNDFRNELDRFFGGFFGLPLERTSPTLRPLFDVDEKEDRYILSVDLPGIPKDQIKIELKDSHLLLAAERKGTSDRSHAKFEQSFELPQGADLDKIEAKYQDGVLRLEIPKAPTAKPRLIQVA